MQKNQNQKRFHKFLRFSGIGVQLGFTMYLSSLAGARVDEYFNFSKPWTTLFFIVLSLVLFVLNLTRQLKKLNNE
ncbi:AtpZ/AtpI family protein [Wenyingzhuangia sp. IMCC45574]